MLDNILAGTGGAGDVPAERVADRPPTP